MGEVIFWVLAGLAIVAVVGHGIWVLVAAIVRGFFSSARSSPADPRSSRQACPRCLATLAAERDDCRVCGWPRDDALHLNPQAALRSLYTQLEQFSALGIVDRPTRDRLVKALEAEAKAVQMAKPAMPAAPAASSIATPAADRGEVEEIVLEPLPEKTEAAPVATPRRPAPSASPAAERVRKYTASREATAAEPLPAPPPERRPREALSRLLASFMEDKNIRWGELVGGLLIVGCSVALVISFWAEIAGQPFLKYVLFNGVTAALFGVGLYTDRKWKLHTTSHGLLIIATLLVPLNFLAIAAFTQESPATDLWSLAGEAASLAVFTVLVFLAARIITPDAAVPLTVGVMLPSLMQLLVRRWAGPAAAISVQYALATVPVLGYVAAVLWPVRRYWKGTAPVALEETAAQRLFILLGIVSAAAFLPLALLASKMPPVMDALRRLSPLAVWCGVPALVVGLLFWRRMTDSRLSGTQTAGIAVGVLGAMVMCAAVVLAWPEPITLLPVALMNAAAFAVIALGFGIPAALVPAGLALVGAWLVGFHLQQGNVDWKLSSYEPMSRALMSIASGHALAPLVGLFAVVASLLGRWDRRADGKMVAIVGGATLVLSLGLVLWFGFGRSGDLGGATWTLGVYAVVALVAAAAIDSAAVAWFGWTLLLAALVQGIVFRWGAALGIERPWVAALLTHATLAAGAWANFALSRHRASRWLVATRQCVAPTSAAAAGLLAGLMLTTSASALAIYFGWLAVVWLAASALLRHGGVLTASQIATVLAIFWAVVSGVETREWYTAAARPWLDPWFLEAQGVALALYCVGWAGLQGFVFRGAKPQAAGLVPRAAVEHGLEVALVALMVLVCWYGAMPGVAQELTPLAAARGEGAAARVVAPIETFELASISHAHAADRGAWLLTAAVLAVLGVGLWRRQAIELRLSGMILALATVCPLLAARWEADVAVASALRWIMAGFFLAISVIIWIRWKWIAARGPLAYRQTRDLLVAIVVFTYVAMGAYVVQAAIGRGGMVGGTDWLWPYLLGWALVGMCAALAVPRAAELAAVARLRSRVVEIPSWARTTRVLLLFAAVAPVAIMFAFAVAAVLDQHPLVGPEPTSWFRRIGHDVSYGVPLAVIALVFVGYAIRDRSSRFAFSAGLLANVVATMVVLIRLVRGGGSLDAAAWIEVAQVNAIVAGVVALVWLGGVRWYLLRADGAKPQAAGAPALLFAQVMLASAICGVFFVPAAVKLALDPTSFAWAATADGVLGWTAFLLAAAAAAWLYGVGSVSQRGIAGTAAGLVILVALTASRWDRGNWLSYYTLLGGCCAAQWLVPIVPRAVGWLMPRQLEHRPPMIWSTFWARSFGLATVVLALRALEPNALSPWWTIAALAVTSARNVWIAWYEGRRGSVWIAAVLVNLAASIWWIDSGYLLTGTPGEGRPFEFMWLNVIAAAGMAIVSVALARPSSESGTDSSGGRQLGFHRFAAWAAVVAMLCTTGVGLAADLLGSSIGASSLLNWLAWMAAVVTAAACLWDPATRWPVACLYSVGLLGVGIYLDGLDFRAPMFPWALANALAAYSLITAYLWSRREAIQAALVRWRVPIAAAQNSSPAETRVTIFRDGGHGWLVSAGVLSALAVLYLVAWVEIVMPEFTMRMIAAYAIGAEALALALLAQGAVRSPLQYTALVFGALFAVAFGCAWLRPAFEAPWLHRAIAAATALAATIAVYGIALSKLLRRENEWTRAAQRLVPLLIAVAAALLVVVLASEVAAFAAGQSVQIAWPALVAVLAALVGLAAAALVAALVPGRDPLGLSERGRMAYVYAAEGLAALAFVHIRVTMPWLFTGWFLRFWPLVVMAIAFVGVGLSEFFQRRRQHILSEPLANTGALLPLLPALGFWITSSDVHFSLLLLSMGALYAGMSVLRKSFLFAVLAAVAANGSLWYLLYQRAGLGIAEHPQLWLIPPALCVLAAGYLNRQRLSAEQLAALRYGSAIVIYASSTADIFINGVADAPWLPGVLAGLSIAGVFAGILLRVRAFLYLGTAFLMVAILTVIWHAAQERTWIYWIAGIVTGVLIIAMFGLFEKRRDDMLRLIDRLKQWEA